GSLAEIDLEVLAAEERGGASAGGVIFEGGGEFGWGGVLAPPRHRAQRNTGGGAHGLELIRRLGGGFRDIHLGRLETVVAVFSGHFDAGCGMRERGDKFVAAHGEAHFVRGSSGRGGGEAQPRQKLAAIQHGRTSSPEYVNPVVDCTPAGGGTQ